MGNWPYECAVFLTRGVCVCVCVCVSLCSIMLMAVYIIIATAFWYHPDTDHELPTGTPKGAPPSHLAFEVVRPF